eukprot:UN27476
MVSRYCTSLKELANNDYVTIKSLNGFLNVDSQRIVSTGINFRGNTYSYEKGSVLFICEIQRTKRGDMVLFRNAKTNLYLSCMPYGNGARSVILNKLLQCTDLPWSTIKMIIDFQFRLEDFSLKKVVLVKRVKELTLNWKR